MNIKELLKNSKDPKIQTEQEVYEYFKLPVLAYIPEYNLGRGATINEKRSHSL